MKKFTVKNYKGNLVESLKKFSDSHKGMKIVEAVEDGEELKIKVKESEEISYLNEKEQNEFKKYIEKNAKDAGIKILDIYFFDLFDSKSNWNEEKLSPKLQIFLKDIKKHIPMAQNRDLFQNDIEDFQKKYDMTNEASVCFVKIKYDDTQEQRNFVKKCYIPLKEGKENIVSDKTVVYVKSFFPRFQENDASFSLGPMYRYSLFCISV